MKRPGRPPLDDEPSFPENRQLRQGETPKRSGRPTLDDEAATTSIHVRVTPAQRVELRRVADENGTGLSGIIREAVNVFVADYQERPRRLFSRSPKP